MISNRRLFVVYFLPYFAYVFIASIFGNFVSIETSYLLRISIVTVAILWARQWYFPLTGPRPLLVSILFGVFTGFLGFIIWIGLLSPFVQPGGEQPWSDSAFILRLFSAGLLVPVFEEILMRGFVLRFALQWDNARKIKEKEPLQAALDERSVNDVKPGDWSWAAIAISTIVFTSGHHIQEWPASIAFGLLMVWLWVVRKDLVSCIVAHSVTNILLALYVLKTGSWHLW